MYSKCSMQAEHSILVPTPLQRHLYRTLVVILDNIKDEESECHANPYYQTVEWDYGVDGEIKMTARNTPYLCVMTTVTVTPLWREYMDDRERNNIHPTIRFNFDEKEEVYEYRVNNAADMLKVGREMKVLNTLRLNWRQEQIMIMIDRRLALAMGLHARLGEKSKIALIPNEHVIETIGKLL